MDFNSSFMQNSTEAISWIDLKSSIFESPGTIGFSSFVATFVSFLAYLAYSPRIDKRSPAFTSDRVPLIGSWGFFTHRWTFFKNSLQRSKTGNFSFWLGKYHVVGISGEAARKMYLDSRQLDFDNGYATLHGIGPELTLPIHGIFQPNFQNGRSYFHRRLLDLTRSEQLAKRLPALTIDARTAIGALGRSSSGITNPFELCYPIIVAMSCRTVGTDDIPNSPELLQKCLDYCLVLQSTSSAHVSATPWLPSLSFAKRWYGRLGLCKIIMPIIDRRLKDAHRVDDALQTLIDNGDSKDYMINFFISTLFAALVNTGLLAGGLLTMLSHHTVWQDKVYNEIRAAVKARSTKKDGSLVEQLDSLPLDAWESSFPSIDLCFKELIRMNAAFPMFRKNTGATSIQIPGGNEVIPPGSFACYHTADAHYNEELFPNPTRYDPERFLEGRQEFMKQTYSFLGWGSGRHPCLGMRWAKLQQNIALVYALAMFEWRGCDADGQPLPPLDSKPNLETHQGLPKGIYCKYTPREKV